MLYIIWFLLRLTLGLVFIWVLVLPETGIWTTVYLTAICVVIELQSLVLQLKERNRKLQDKVLKYTGDLGDNPRERSKFMERLRQARKEAGLD